MEFFPDIVLFEGTPFAMNRIMILRMVVVLLLILVFWLGTRRMKMVPGRFQSVIEIAVDFVRVGIAEDLLGKKDGRRFTPLLLTFFFTILAMNITGIIPGINIAATSVIGVPLVFAVFAYIAWIYAGLRKHPWTFIKNTLFPPGVPKGLYLIVAPLEFISSFIVRPFTHTLRLLMNMIVGHLLLVLFFAATHFFFVGNAAGTWFSLFGVGTLAFGIAFTFFEILVAVLQAYVFTILAAVYLQLALAEEH